MQELELLVRTAIFKQANSRVGFLLQWAVDRIDAAYTPKPGEQRRGRHHLQVQGLFGSFEPARDYYYHPAKGQGHFPADAALGLEVGYTPALARLMCLEGADETGHQKAEQHPAETGGNQVSARQIQRVAQRVGQEAQLWQERPAQPARCDAPVMYVTRPVPVYRSTGNERRATALQYFRAVICERGDGGEGLLMSASRSSLRLDATAFDSQGSVVLVPSIWRWRSSEAPPRSHDSHWQKKLALFPDSSQSWRTRSIN